MKFLCISLTLMLLVFHSNFHICKKCKSMSSIEMSSTISYLSMIYAITFSGIKNSMLFETDDVFLLLCKNN